MLNIVKLPDESSDFVGFYHSFRNRHSDFFGEYHGMYNQTYYIDVFVLVSGNMPYPCH